MGEYLTTHTGTRIKLGTCETLYYVRYDEVLLESAINKPFAEYLDPKGTWIYRFPNPLEDGESVDAANSREPFGYPIFNVSGIDIAHEDVCLPCGCDGAYNINVFVACPASNGIKSYRVSQNGAAHPIKITGERIRENVKGLYTICECGYCGAAFGLDEKEAELLKAAILAHEPIEDQPKPNSWYKQFAARIKARIPIES